MCIAIASMKNCPLPSKEILQRCFRTNPDGAGFAYAYHNTVYTYKGFFDFPSFYKQLAECDEKYNLTENGVLLHTRITTHGLTNTANCHPFPVTSNTQKLTAGFSKSKYAIVHNGICTCTARSSSKEPLSDTALFVRDYLSKIATFDNWFDSPGTIPLIETLIESKIALLNNKGEIRMTSGFHQGEDGCFYSNYSYEDFPLGYYGYGANWYDDYCMSEEQDEMPLTELKRGESILYEDGSFEDYCAEYHSYFRTFVTEAYEVYVQFKDGTHDRRIPMEQLSYVGSGELVDRFSHAVPFRTDAVAVL